VVEGGRDRLYPLHHPDPGGQAGFRDRRDRRRRDGRGRRDQHGTVFAFTFVLGSFLAGLGGALIVRALEEQILRLKEAGISILLSEQNLKSSLRLIDRAYIIDNGRIRYHGMAKELEDNEEIRRMHLMI